MEFQSGKEATLKPVEIYTSNQNSDDVVFNVAGSEEVFASWTLQVKSKEGMTQNFGPFSDENISIPKKSIMGNQPAGDFNITMNGTTKTGNNVTKETVIYLSPTVAPEVQESLRFSVLYEYDESKSISIYEKYLTEIVTPKIPVNGMVIITGYTDIIGDMDYNKILSLARANDVKSILEKSLAAAGRTDVGITTKNETNLIRPLYY
jgi:outer membrane protein OmpA-like peptidoglycan-associated protein